MIIGDKNIRIEPSEFKGKVYVGIRQWYEADGEMKPGNKGINLSIEEWDEFMSKLNDIKLEIDRVRK